MAFFGDSALIDPQLSHVLSIVRSKVRVPFIMEAVDGATRARKDEAEAAGAKISYRAQLTPQLHGEILPEDFQDLAQSGVAHTIWYDRPHYVLDDPVSSFFSSGEQLLNRLRLRSESFDRVKQKDEVLTFLGGMGPFKLSPGSAIFGLDDSRRFVRSMDLAVSQDARGQGVRVGVIDTGADESHPMLQGIVKGHESFVNEPAGTDGNGHGSWICSALAGQPVKYDGKISSKNGVILQGMAPDARLFVAKALNSEGAGASSSVIQSLEWCVNQDVDIISMSLGSFFGEAGLSPDARTVNAAAKKGVRVVVAAGNSFLYGTVGSPASAAEAITVGSVAMRNPFSGSVSSFSSKGPTSSGRLKPDISGPGGQLGRGTDEFILGAASGHLAENSGERYGLERGTSQATPIVAGLLAQLVPLGLPKDRGQIESIFAAGARTTGDVDGFLAHRWHLKDNRKGWGIADGVGFYDAIKRKLPGLPIRDVVSRVSGQSSRPGMGLAARLVARAGTSGVPTNDPNLVRLTLV